VAVASAAIAIGLVDPSVREDGMALPARSASSLDLAVGTRVPGSPYLSTAGVLVLPPEGGSARALLPQERNRASDPARVDEGAIAGLADSCAAYAAHLRAPSASPRGGVTVSMALAFHASLAEDLIGVGVVQGHAAGCYTAAVDVAGAASGASVATGFAVYRLPA
jgi:acyl-coenzyme A thioesterase PaaI-like protein